MPGTDVRTPFGRQILASRWPAVLAVAVLYAAIVKVVQLTATLHGDIAPIFPAAGLALAAVLILGWAALPGVWLGSVAAHFITYGPNVFGPFIAGGATLGAAAAAALVRRFGGREDPLRSARSVLVLVTTGAFASGLVSSAVGVLTLWLGGIIPGRFSGYALLTWLLGDGFGIIVAAPLILAWRRPPAFRLAPRQVPEAVLLCGATLLLCILVFFRNLPFEYGLIPPLIWAAFRFGMRGATTAAAAIAFLATIGTVQGRSPFVRATANESLLSLHAFLAVAIILALVLAGLVAERERVGEQNRALLQAVPDLIFLLDREGSFLLVHTGSPDLLYLPPDALLGRRIPELFPPALSEAFMSAIGSTLLTGGQQRLEYRLPLAVGERSFEARLVPCTAQTVLAVARDVTERTTAEAERERLIGELEVRNAELERFTYTVSHDLKSPLVTIRGFLGYLEQSALAGDAARARADVERIRQATDRMDRLLRELLELSRAGRTLKPPEPVALGDVVREALSAVEGRLLGQGIDLEVAPALPVVLGDRTRLTEVVQNLLDNALTWTRSAARPRIEIGVRPPGADGMPVVFVRDNGVGIDPRYTERVFGLFEKLDPKSEGTGIGLALVRRIVEVHGGRVWAESEGEGRGATFCFTLPEATKGGAA